MQNMWETSYQIQTSRNQKIKIKSNQIKSNQTKSNHFKSNQTRQTIKKIDAEMLTQIMKAQKNADITK